MHAKLTDFITTGDLPPSAKERNLLLDLARTELSQTHTNTNTPPHKNMVIFNTKQKAEHEKFLSLKELQAKASAAGFGNLTAQASESPIHKTTNDYLRSVGKPPILAAPPRKPAATATTVHRAALPTAQAAPVATGTITAAEFGTKQMVMVRGEFDKLSPADKSRLFAEGGKLIDPVEVKPTHKGGQLTRAGFNTLTPAGKSAHCKAKLPIID
jgi:hypothetical protein